MFAETGLLVGFFLPGDSLLFTAGLLCPGGSTASSGHLSLPWVLVAAAVGAPAGAQTGYLLGRRAGPALLARATSRGITEGAARACGILERYGHAKAIVPARFLPPVRTLLNPLAGALAVPSRTFAVLMLLGWWQARAQDARQAVKALAAPVLTVLAFAVSTVLKQAVHENRPCRSLHVITLEACPAPGDWSFPSNHATLAAAAAVVLWFVSTRLGVIATVGALAMAASRVWVGAHYPHDVLAGLAVGALVALPLALLLSRHARTVAGLLGRTRLRLLIAS
ncbi:phosphatase PAP2 family protein [Streptomyces sp. PsTaAH-124]|uniref:phosphatase PAP2 family protein n=1 Tax=Streptomyces sp. PsTaAH-124 TaxID=1157638 RepID=UPI00036912B9|nr:phosphatase PAP2 family protein [Streptomyces sp. PsTaAH-124]